MCWAHFTWKLVSMQCLSWRCLSLYRQCPTKIYSCHTQISSVVTSRLLLLWWAESVHSSAIKVAEATYIWKVKSSKNTCKNFYIVLQLSELLKNTWKGQIVGAYLHLPSHSKLPGHPQIAHLGKKSCLHSLHFVINRETLMREGNFLLQFKEKVQRAYTITKLKKMSQLLSNYPTGKQKQIC